MKLKRVRQHELEGKGRWVEGRFVFHPLPQQREETRCARVSHEPTVSDRVSAWPDYSGPRDGRSFRIEGFLPYPQPNRMSYAQSIPALSRMGAGML